MLASIPATVGAALPKRTYPELPIAVGDVSASEPNLLPKSQVFQDQVTARAEDSGKQ